MANARDTIAQALEGEGCLGHANPEEPVFVLRAQDKYAPLLVELWAHIVEAQHGSSAKTRGAFDITADMRSWQAAMPAGGKVPD